MSSFAERAKAKAAAFKEKSKEAFAAASTKIDDLSVKPCVQCGTKAGVMRYDCQQCNTQKFCFKCTDYCSVTHALKPVFTTKEKAVHLKDTAAEKSVELYNKALLKWKNRKASTAAAGGTGAEGADINGTDHHIIASGTADGSGAGSSSSSASARAAAAAAEDPSREKIDEYTTKSVCRLCFRNSIQTLDLSRNYDIIGPYDNAIHATIIAVHGAGNTRGSLRRMAEQLVPYKIRTILIDLPGHGGRMDEPLSLETAVDAVHTAATTLMQQATEKDTAAGLLLLMGVGLGGYVAMEYLGRSSPRKFDGAIIVNAGIGVGRDEASLLSRAALSLASSASQHLGAKAFTMAALRELKKVPTLMKDEVHENMVDTGLFFHSAAEQLATVRSVATKAALARFFSPVLFMDGSKDFHDMVDVFTKISVDNELRTFRRGGEGDGADGAANDEDTVEGGLIILSRSTQYPNANHHFMHDTRFSDEAFADIALFVDQLVQRAELLARSPNLVLSTEELEGLVRRQQEAAAVAVAAAAAEAAAKPSIFERAKLFGASLRKGDDSTGTNGGSSSANANNSVGVDTASNAATAGDASSCSVTSGAEAEEEAATRASSASVAVPFVATEDTEYSAPAPAEPTYEIAAEDESEKVAEKEESAQNATTDKPEDAAADAAAEDEEGGEAEDEFKTSTGNKAKKWAKKNNRRQ